LKPAESLRVFGYVVGQELESHKTTKFDVLGLIDHTRPAAAQFLDNAVMLDGLADHRVTPKRASKASITLFLNSPGGSDSAFPCPSIQCILARHAHHIWPTDGLAESDSADAPTGQWRAPPNRRRKINASDLYAPTAPQGGPAD